MVERTTQLLVGQHVTWASRLQKIEAVAQHCKAYTVFSPLSLHDNGQLRPRLQENPHRLIYTSSTNTNEIFTA